MANIISEHLSQEVATDIKVLLRDLKKVIRVMTLYPEDNPLPNRMRGSYGGRFIELVNEFNGFNFSIRPGEILYDREVVYTDKSKEEALADIFYKAGIVFLEFSEGLVFEEFARFLELLKIYLNSRSRDSDLVSLLWQEQFSNIKFKTVEDLALGEFKVDSVIEDMYPDYGRDGDQSPRIDYNRIVLDEEAGEAEGPALAGVEALLPQTVEDGREMGLSFEPPSDEMRRTIEQVLTGHYTPAEEESREIARLLEDNRNFDPDRAAARIMLEILHLWNEPKPFKETVAICEKVFDQLLEHGSFAVAADFVHAMRERQEELSARKPSLAGRLNDFILRAGDSARIKKLTEIINLQEVIDGNAVEVYLDSLGWESLVHITGMLGRLVSREARRMVCKYLAQRGQGRLNIIANGLHDRRWYVVRNTVAILGRIGGEEVLDYLATTALHDDVRVRKEVMRSLNKITSDRAVDIMFGFLRDPEAKLRVRSLEYLARMGGRRSFESIRNIVHAPDFAAYPLEEQEQFLIAYSRLGGAEVTDFLGSIIGSFSLLYSGWKARYRFMALKALAYNVSDEAERLLLKYTRSRRTWLRQAAVSALDQRRRYIYEKKEKRR